MPTFEYIVRTQDGKRLEGKIDADNLNHANEKLLQKKYTVIKLSENEVVFDFLGPFLDRLTLEIEKLKNKVPLNTLVFFKTLIHSSNNFFTDLSVQCSITWEQKILVTVSFLNGSVSLLKS